jgi:hypothetical protein
LDKHPQGVKEFSSRYLQLQKFLASELLKTISGTLEISIDEQSRSDAGTVHRMFKQTAELTRQVPVRLDAFSRLNSLR